MKPADFPYDCFLDLKQKKEQEFLAFLQSPTIDDIPVVVRPPCNVWGQVAHYPEQSLELQLEALALTLQIPSDFIYSYLEPWHGVGVFANIFGCQVNWNDFDAPQTLPIYRTVEDLKGLKRPHILESELAQMVLQTIRYFRQVTGDCLDISLTDTQSPNDSASLIMDTCEFFASSLAEPDLLAPFMEMVTDVMIEFSDMQFDAMGPKASHPGHIMLSAPSLPGIAISDDNMAVISKAAYRNAALPYNSRLGEHFGSIAIHTCGDFVQNYAIVKQVKNLQLIDCAVAGVDPTPNHADRLAAAFAGTGIVIKARIGGEEHWHVLDDLIRPDLKLIVQLESDGNIENSQREYEQLKTRCNSILARKKAA
jgi:hypothetical protein